MARKRSSRNALSSPNFDPRRQMAKPTVEESMVINNFLRRMQVGAEEGVTTWRYNFEQTGHDTAKASLQYWQTAVKVVTWMMRLNKQRGVVNA